MQRAELMDFWHDGYEAGSSVLAVAGRVRRDEVLAEPRAALRRDAAGRRAAVSPLARRVENPAGERRPPRLRAGAAHARVRRSRPAKTPRGSPPAS